MMWVMEKKSASNSVSMQYEQYTENVKRLFFWLKAIAERNNFNWTSQGDEHIQAFFPTIGPLPA